MGSGRVHGLASSAGAAGAIQPLEYFPALAFVHLLVSAQQAGTDPKPSIHMTTFPECDLSSVPAVNILHTNEELTIM